jgi:glycosyltransferase involved in cell wall biosynthesis
LEEPLGLSVLEAQYLRLPCIVSDVGGLKILVDDLKTGLRVPAADAGAIGLAIKKLMHDKILTRTISENAHKQVIEKFDFADKVKEYVALYQEVLNENTTG